MFYILCGMGKQSIILDIPKSISNVYICKDNHILDPTSLYLLQTEPLTTTRFCSFKTKLQQTDMYAYISFVFYRASMRLLKLRDSSPHSGKWANNWWWSAQYQQKSNATAERNYPRGYFIQIPVGRCGHKDAEIIRYLWSSLFVLYRTCRRWESVHYVCRGGAYTICIKPW